MFAFALSFFALVCVVVLIGVLIFKKTYEIAIFVFFLGIPIYMNAWEAAEKLDKRIAEETDREIAPKSE